MLIIFAKLFNLAVIQGNYYAEQLLSQHYVRSELKAKRGQIYVTDRSGNYIQLTDNIDYFTLFVDPKFVPDKPKLIEILTPILYDHLCVSYGVQQPDGQQCLEHLEVFTRQDLLPDEFGQFVASGEQLYYVVSGDYTNQIQEVVSTFTKERAYALIQQRLDALITIGYKELNYLGVTEDDELKAALAKLPYIDVEPSGFVYVRQQLVTEKDKTAAMLFQLLKNSGWGLSYDQLRVLVRPQENRYVKIAEGMNARLAERVRTIKNEAFDTFNRSSRAQRAAQKLPLLHGVGLEATQKRYYPHGRFASHILGYVNNLGKGAYGVEEYFDNLLRGKDGKLVGLSTPWIGEVGANNFVIEKPEEGSDIYLTIDPIIQKEVEVIANEYRTSLRADSVAVTVLDPWTGKIKALVNAPDYDPNNIGESYKLLPVGFDQSQLIQNPTYVDIPLFYLSGAALKQATFNERTAPGLKKYYFQNRLGPLTFIDKNIALPYEPGSIMKVVTMGVALDSDTIGLYDYYNDPGKVQVGEYTIANVSNTCKGDHTFLHALEFSCNIGMIRVAQLLSKYIFYNYFERIGFGKPTGVELAGEDGGRLPDFNSVPLVQFYNNTFGQGMLATPLQMAMAYATVINGGTLYAPTIIEATTSDGKRHVREPRVVDKIFKPQTSELMREAMESVVNNGLSRKFHRPGYTLGAKSGTPQIAFKGRYQNGAGRTNGSMMGLITAANPKYIIAVQVRRPRNSPWGDETAGRVFERITDFLLTYERIEK